MNLKPICREARITVPSSSANVGPGFDCWCFGLASPELTLTYRPREDGEIIVEERSGGRVRRSDGSRHAGGKALSYFLDSIGLEGRGADLLYLDQGYPVGKGLGRSGAEAVGAIAGAAAVYGLRLTRDELVFFAGFGEPGADPGNGKPGHLDNASGSANGRFNIVAASPRTGDVRVFVYDVPRSLGVALGFSSFEKTGGTEAMRKVLEEPVSKSDYVNTLGWVSAATAGLVSGNVDQFLEFMWDVFHESRRADAGGYGGFDSKGFFGLKKQLYDDFGVVLNVSGAGPNLLFLYDKGNARRWEKQKNTSFIKAFGSVVEEFFKQKRIGLDVKAGAVARGGGYDCMVKRYGLGRLRVDSLEKRIA